MSGRDFRTSIIDTLAIIDTELRGSAEALHFSYKMQRSLLDRAFADSDGSTPLQVMMRLTLIDSLYSTNAAYSYYSIEEMAERLCSIGSERQQADYFYSIVQGGGDTQRLFNEPYGIRKNLSEGSKQMSLLSKYAYYLLLMHIEYYPLGFPIYDSLVREMAPKLARRLGLKLPKGQVFDASIEQYIQGLDTLRRHIFVGNKAKDLRHQAFDLLDAYLWRIGKMDGGNYSLLLDRGLYIRFIENLGLKNSSLQSKDFDPAVRQRCLNMGLQAIQGIEDTAFCQIYTHWLGWYV